MNPGDAIANSYVLPTEAAQKSVRPIVQKAPSDPNDMDKYYGMPEVQAGLQYTGDMAEISHKYFTLWADAKGFAQRAKSQYGIDVTKPDPTVPGSIEAHEAFKQATARLMWMGDLLKEGQTQFKEQNKLAAENKFRFNGQQNFVPGSMMSADQFGVSLETPPAVKAAQGAINVAHDRGEDFNQALAQKGAVVESFDPSTPQGAQDQLAAQTALNPRMNIPAPSSWQLGMGNAAQIGQQEIGRVATHMSGVIDPKNMSIGGFYVTKENPKGTYMIEAQAFEGVDNATIPVGPSQQRETIDKTIIDPKTKHVYFTFKEPGVDPVRIDNMHLKTLLSTIKGIDQKAVEAFLAQNSKFLKADWDANKEMFINKKLKEDSDAKIKELTPEAERLNKKLEEQTKGIEAKGATWYDPRTWRDPYGKAFTSDRAGNSKLKIVPNDDGTFRIDGFYDAFDVKTQLPSKDFNPDSMTPAEVKKAISFFKMRPVGEAKEEDATTETGGIY